MELSGDNRHLLPPAPDRSITPCLRNLRRPWDHARPGAVPAAPGLRQVTPSSWKCVFVPLQGLPGRSTSSVGGEGVFGTSSGTSQLDPTCCRGLGVG